MKLSEKERTKLYSAIAGKIMDLRVKAAMTQGLLSHLEVDEWLSKLERDIWNDIRHKMKWK